MLSKTGIGLSGIIVFVLVLAGQTFGLDIAEAEAVTFAQNIAGVVGFVLAIYGQLRRKDLKFGMVRKA